MSKTASYQDIARLIGEAESIVVAGHTSPDGDSVASALCMCLCLHKMGKNPHAIMEKRPSRYSFIPGKEFLYTQDISKLAPDLFICVDCGDIGRLGKAAEVFKGAKTTLNIDHHTSNTFFADYNMVAAGLSSTSEMIYGIASYLGPLDSHMATALYAGILFDTGGFRFASVTPRTMEIVADLLRYNIPSTEIYCEILRGHSLPEAKVFARAISRMELDSGIAYSFICAADMVEFSAQWGELESIVGYMMDTKGAEIAVFAYEKQDGEVKISLRSKELNVSKIAAHFGGGGHVNAAGCSFTRGVISECLEIVLKHIKGVYHD